MTEYTQNLSKEGHHKKPNYLAIFGVLALVTLIEVTLASNIPILLIILSISKIVLVAMYYMHLKFESGWFTAIFMVPMPFVILIIAVMLVALAPASGSAEAAAYCSFW